MTELDVEFQIHNPPWSPDLSGQGPTWQLPRNSTSNALETFRVAKAGAGKLYGFQGFSNRGSAQFVQVFDAATLPADGAVPVIVITVAATSNFSGYFGSIGRTFYEGIILCNSSTVATKTIGSADCWFDVQYA